MIKLLELFWGIGACSAALDRLGVEYEIADYVEIDKYAVASYNAIHKTDFQPQDITKWDKDIEVDLIMHGSPCQDFSVAGLGRGGDEGSGTRSSLMYETIRIVKKLRPKYVIWENVKGLLSKKHSHNFSAYIETMEQLGYISYYQVLNSKNYGIPQNRERIFTISILGGGSFVFPEPFELKLRLKDLLEEDVDEKYYLSDKLINFFYKNEEKQKSLGNGFRFNVSDGDCIAKAITTLAGHRMDDNFISEPLLINSNNKKGYEEAYEGDSINLQRPNSKTRRGKVGHSVAQTLDTQCSQAVVEPRQISLKRGYSVDVNAEKEDSENVDIIGNYSKSDYMATAIVGKNGIAPTVRENHGQVTGVVEPLAFDEQNQYIRQDGCVGSLTTDGNSPKHNNRVIEGVRIRKLTPLECWRLQGFPDEYFYKAQEVNSNTQLYKQAGNSITVDVLYYILKNLLTEQPEFKGQMSIEDFL